MKILHVVESFGGGSINLIMQIAQHTPDLNHVVVHGIRPDEDPEAVKQKFPKGITFVEWPHIQREVNPTKDTRAYFALKSILKTQQPNVLHLHSSKAGFLGRAAVKTPLKPKTFYNPHGAPFLRQDISKRKRKLFIRLEKWADRRAGTSIFVSPSEANEYHKVGIKGVTINNCIWQIPQQLNLPHRHPNDPFVVVNSGRLTFQKNPALFNQIAQQLTHDPRFKFVWIGDGSLRHLLTASNISITGWQNPAGVNQYLQQAHGYLSTSLWEGLPYSALEALGYGLPMVLNNCVGNVDLVNNNLNGIIFKHPQAAAQQLTNYANHPNQWQKAAQASFEFLKQNFNPDINLKQYRKLYLA